MAILKPDPPALSGCIKFIRHEEGWGKLKVDNNAKDIYFNVKDLKGEIFHLYAHSKSLDEPVNFEIIDSIRKNGEKQAVNIQLDTNKRKTGTILDFDKEKGFGFIEDYNSKEKIFFHHSAIRKERGDKYVRVTIGEAIVYSLGKNEKGDIATDILLIDERSEIETFAFFRNIKEALTKLSQSSEKEDWDYFKKKTKGIPVLTSYINHTCKRLIIQNKIVKGKSSKEKRDFAYFNTGLVTPQQDEIFAYFIKNPDYQPLSTWGVESPEWEFLSFDTEYSPYRKYFIDEPEIASYFSDAEIADLIFDTSVKVRPNRDHLLRRKSRVESEKISQLDDDDFIEKIKEAIELAVKRIKRNYKTAIPHFYDGSIQFLLPLCVKSNKAQALGALVVKKEENIYEAHTILTLDQAYNNARLLAKPDREWLNP